MLEAQLAFIEGMWMGVPVSVLDPASCLLKFRVSHWVYVNEL